MSFKYSNVFKAFFGSTIVDTKASKFKRMENMLSQLIFMMVGKKIHFNNS